MADQRTLHTKLASTAVLNTFCVTIVYICNIVYTTQAKIFNSSKINARGKQIDFSRLVSMKMPKTWFSEFLYMKRTGVVGRLWDIFQVEDHSRNSVSYIKSLRILALESLEALKMYYVIGASIPSPHRESTDSLII